MTILQAKLNFTMNENECLCLVIFVGYTIVEPKLSLTEMQLKESKHFGTAYIRSQY